MIVSGTFRGATMLPGYSGKDTCSARVGLDFWMVPVGTM